MSIDEQWSCACIEQDRVTDRAYRIDASCSYALSEIEQLIVLVKALQGRNDLAQTVIPQHQLPAQQIQNDQIVALLAKKKVRAPRSSRANDRREHRLLLTATRSRTRSQHLRQASERLHTTATRLRQQVEQKREQAEVLLALRRKWMMIRKVGAANRPSRLAIDYGIVHGTRTSSFTTRHLAFTLAHSPIARYRASLQGRGSRQGRGRCRRPNAQGRDASQSTQHRHHGLMPSSRFRFRCVCYPVRLLVGWLALIQTTLSL